MNVIKTYDPSGRRHIELLVQQQNRTVTIKAGTFKEDGVEYRLTDDYAYDLPAAGNLMVCGYLVKNTTDNSAHVLVDDAASGHEIDWSVVSQYKLLHQLFCFVAPANLSNLDKVDLLVFHVLPVLPDELRRSV